VYFGLNPPIKKRKRVWVGSHLLPAIRGDTQCRYNTGGAGVAGVAGGARLRASLLLDAFDPRIGGRTFRERERVRETGAGTKTPDLLYF